MNIDIIIKYTLLRELNLKSGDNNSKHLMDDVLVRCRQCFHKMKHRGFDQLLTDFDLMTIHDSIRRMSNAYHIFNINKVKSNSFINTLRTELALINLYLPTHVEKISIPDALNSHASDQEDNTNGTWLLDFKRSMLLPKNSEDRVAGHSFFHHHQNESDPNWLKKLALKNRIRIINSLPASPVTCDNATDGTRSCPI